MNENTVDVDALLTEHYTELTPSQQRLADYVLQYTAEAALMSSKEMAERLEVSEATVVRFAQQLGFAGYPQFRHLVQRKLLRDIRSSERIASLLHDEDVAAGPLHEMVNTTTQQMQLLLQNVSEEDVAAVVDAVIRARTTFIFAEGVMAAATWQLGFWLNRLGCDVHIINQTGRRFFESAVRASTEDTALVFSFRSLGPEATALLEHVHNKKGTAILITDVANSPAHNFARQVLRVYRGPMGTFRPLGAVSALCDAIILGIMLAKGEQGVQQLQQLDDLRQRYGFL